MSALDWERFAPSGATPVRRRSSARLGTTPVG